MITQIVLGEIVLDVTQKKIKNLHLSVHPPTGRVRIAAPLHMDPDTIRIFAIAKLSWIRQQQQKFLLQERETPREYLNRESHYLWGHRYLLEIEEKEATPEVQLKHSTLLLQVRPAASKQKKQEVLEEWYRGQLKKAALPLLETWERRVGVKVASFFVQRMKTKWGSCSPTTSTIRLNSELAKKPPECLEYLIVHELVHLLEPTHNQRFLSLMDQYMPFWQTTRDALNRLPVSHEDWDY